MKKQEVLKDKAGTIEYQLWEDGLQQVPATATVSITDPGGSELSTPVTDASCTIGADGTVSYSIASSNSGTLGEGYKAVFSINLTLSTSPVTYRTVYATVLYDVVLSILQPIVTYEDLIKEYPVLVKEGFHKVGEVTATTGRSSITDTETNAGNEPTDAYAGWLFEALDGTNQGFQSIITAYSAGVFTFKKSAAADWTVGDEYRIQNRYWNEIERAWEKLTDEIRTRGKRPALVMDSTELKEVHILGTIALILFGMGRLEQYQEYRKLYAEGMQSLRLRYDGDESGIPADATTAQMQYVKIRR